MSQQDWSQHILIRSLCNPKLEKVNRKAFAEITQNIFTHEAYRQAYQRIDSIYAKQNRFVTWKELVNDPALSEETRRRLRSKEVKRKSVLKTDKSVVCPYNYEEYQSVIEAVKVRARQSALVELHNSFSDSLKEDMTSNEVESVVATMHETLARMDVLTASTGKLFQVTAENTRQRFKQFYKELKNRMFIPTGYRDYDNRNVGIPKDGLWVIAGKTGCGKSSLALDVLMNMREFGCRVCLMPLEMSIEQMLLRMGSNLLGVPSNELIKDFKKWYKPLGKAIKDFLKESDDDPACFDFYVPDENESLSQALKVLSPQKYDIICCDYLQLMGSENGKDDWTSIDISGKRAKRFASKEKTAVCLLAQLDDRNEDIRYAKALKEHASNLWMWTENSDEIRECGFITIKQPKARGQDPTPFRLRADLSISRFADYIDEETSSGFKKHRRTQKLAEGFDDTDVPGDDEI